MTDIIIPTEKTTRAPRKPRVMVSQAPQKEPERAAVPAVQSSEQQLITIIQAMAENPQVDVEKMKAIMDMNERIIERNAKAEFSADLVQMKPHLPKIEKLHFNNQTKSKYAKLEDINVKIDPILERFGFATTTKVIAQTEKSVTVQAELWHRAGHVESTEVVVPLDDRGIAGTVNKTPAHATSSSISYGKRIAICALLNISTGDDKDGNGNRTIDAELPDDKRSKLDSWLVAAGDGAEGLLLDYLKIGSLTEVNTANYMTAITFLKQRVPVKNGGEAQ